jgi:hypothetical protein
MPGVFLLSPGPVFADPNKQVIHANDTVSSDGYIVLTGYGVSEVSLFINILAAPTGVASTIQYTIQEVEPGNDSTVIGSSVSSSVITGISVQRISIICTFSGSIKISWALGGTGGPTFTKVYATLVGKAGSIALTDKNGLAIDSSNPLNITTAPASNAGLTNVASSASNVTLLAANTARKGATIYNDSTANLCVKFGVTASLTSFTVLIVSGGYFEFPLPVYTGIVDGIWSSANGAARITEIS